LIFEGQLKGAESLPQVLLNRLESAPEALEFNSLSEDGSFNGDTEVEYHNVLIQTNLSDNEADPLNLQG